MMQARSQRVCDVLAFGSHPDDLELIMGGTAAKLVQKAFSVLLMVLCTGEPAGHGAPRERYAQALKTAVALGLERTALTL
jgi:N-acetylglucosamine malate deacetylase 1